MRPPSPTAPPARMMRKVLKSELFSHGLPLRGRYKFRREQLDCGHTLVAAEPRKRAKRVCPNCERIRELTRLRAHPNSWIAVMIKRLERGDFDQ